MSQMSPGQIVLEGVKAKQMIDRSLDLYFIIFAIILLSIIPISSLFLFIGKDDDKTNSADKNKTLPKGFKK